ncbi:MAG: OmpA family protein [Planctomycetota bacterium]|jgi:chemotaxis protein MotB|nr:OmpA family protein [Planctomycetota bacterium]
MKPTLLITAALAGSLLFAGGCGRGDVEVDELRAENERLTQQLEDVYAEASLLEKQRNAAREENLRLREQLKGAEQQLRRFASTGGMNNDVIEISEEGSLVVKDVAFKTGSADLSDEGVKAINALAKELQGGDYAGTNVIVVGHTDNTPVVRKETQAKFGDNWGLSAMRSASVVRQLQKAGVSPQRLRGAFKGEHQPRADNKSKDGKSQNRRVEIWLSL